MTKATRLLGEMKKGDSGVILLTGGPLEIRRRLLEMGLLEGSTISIEHEAPFGKDPIAVRVRGALLALRRTEANYVQVHVQISEESAQ